MMTFDEFMAQPDGFAPWQRSQHVVAPGLKLYVRKPWAKLRPHVDVELATIDAENPGQGALTAFLDKYEKVYNIYVENALEPRFQAYFVRRGYHLARHDFCYEWLGKHVRQTRARSGG